MSAYTVPMYQGKPYHWNDHGKSCGCEYCRESFSSDCQRHNLPTTEVQLATHGLFVARTIDVVELMNISTKAQMIREIRGLWSDLFTRKELQGYPTYVLACILRQL